jgi:hypothetical protein
VEIGLTFIVEVSAPPGDQEYVLAPLAVSSIDSPLQMVCEGGFTPTNGSVFTVIFFTMGLLWQPSVDVPTTLYEIFAVGETTMF